MKWIVDLEAATVTRREGWSFRFSQVDKDTFDGRCEAYPEPVTRKHLAQAARIAREAGDIYVQARRDRH